jgi:methionyl-tRNA formyltransferase
MRYLRENGMDISLVVIEAGVYDYKLPKTAVQFSAAHRKYAKLVDIKKDTGRRLPSFLIALWMRLPKGVRITVKSLYYIIPFGNLFSVRKEAKKLGIPTVVVESHSSQETKRLLNMYDISYVLLASSAGLIREPLLSMEKTKIISAHPAKLPNHRSLDSLPWSLVEKDQIGLTAFIVDEGIDTGPILLFMEVKPQKGDNLITLRQRVDSKRPEIFLKAIRGLRDGNIKPIPQGKSEGVHHLPMTLEELRWADRVLHETIQEQ